MGEQVGGRFGRCVAAVVLGIIPLWAVSSGQGLGTAAATVLAGGEFWLTLELSILAVALLATAPTWTWVVCSLLFVWSYPVVGAQGPFTYLTVVACAVALGLVPRGPGVVRPARRQQMLWAAVGGTVAMSVIWTALGQPRVSTVRIWEAAVLVAAPVCLWTLVVEGVADGTAERDRAGEPWFARRWLSWTAPAGAGEAGRTNWLVPFGAWIIGVLGAYVVHAATMQQRVLAYLWPSGIRMDALSYVSIAVNGVQTGEWPNNTVDKMPGYPMLIRLVDSWFDDVNKSAVLAATVMSLLALAALYCWGAVVGLPERARRFLVVAVVVYPYGFFLFGLGYAESTFLVLALVGFMLIDRERPLAAGAVVAASTLTRPAGVAMLTAIVVAAIAHELPRLREARRAWRPGRWSAAVGLASSGLLAYGAWCWVRFGTPFAYLTGQDAISNAGNRFSPATWLMSWTQAAVFLDNFTFWDRANIVVQFLLMIGSILSLPMVWKRFGPHYVAYVVVTLMLILSITSALASSGRYLVAAIPLFGLVALWMSERPRVAIPILVGSAALWALLYVQFIDGVPYAI